MKISIRKSTITVFILLVAFFQNSLLKIIPIIGYFDEIIALFAFIYFLTEEDNFLNNKYQQLLTFSGILFIWGLLCNAIFKIQPYLLAIIEDVISNFKFILFYLGIIEFLRRNVLDTKAVLKKIIPLIKIFMGMLFILACVNIFIDIVTSIRIYY